MLSIQALTLVSAAAGLLTGPAVVFAAPRLVAYRLPEPIPMAPPAVLLPLLGIWITRWRPWRALLTEAVMTALFGALALKYGWSIRLPLAAAFTWILVAIAYIDLDHRRVLDRLSVPGFVLAVATSWLWPGLGLVSALLGALVGLAVFGALQVLGRGALGTGDTKLAIVIGAMRGISTVLQTLFLGVVLGGLAALFLMVVLRRGRRDYFAYAPYLSAGAIVSFFLLGP